MESEQWFVFQARLIFRHRRKMTFGRGAIGTFCTPVLDCFYLKNTAHAQAFSLFSQNGGHAPTFCTIVALR